MRGTAHGTHMWGKRCAEGWHERRALARAHTYARTHTRMHDQAEPRLAAGLHRHVEAVGAAPLTMEGGVEEAINAAGVRRHVEAVGAAPLTMEGGVEEAISAAGVH